jgi:SAM-dependent methyltransferase
MSISRVAVARSSEINWDLLRGVLRCPACEHDPLELRGINVCCPSCGKKYAIEDGVIDFLGDVVRNPPRFYKNVFYRRFIQQLDAVHAAHYQSDSLSARIELAIKNDLFSLVESAVAPSVDLGCGLGEGFRMIGHDEDLVGVDASLPLLKVTKRLHPKASVVRADLAQLPFQSNTLRRVFANAVLEHVFFLERAVEQVQRCLADSGRFYVGVPTEGSLAVALARLVTSRRNAGVLAITPAQSRIAQRIDHCNTICSLDNTLRKYFSVEARSFWPFKVHNTQVNLSVAYRLRHLPGV